MSFSGRSVVMRLNRCYACQKCKPYWEFVKDQSRASKLASSCFDCKRVYRSTPIERIKKRLCGRMEEKYGKMNRSECEKLLGAKWDVVVNHITGQLKDAQTLQEMQIDHKIEFSSNEPKEVVCHYTNLQLLTKEQHRKKTKETRRLAILARR